jgi:hypothetical protein
MAQVYRPRLHSSHNNHSSHHLYRLAREMTKDGKNLG